MSQVTNEMIDAWKAEHKRVFKTTLDGVTYYFTTLKRDTYINLLTSQATVQGFDYEFETLKACVLHPALDEQFKTDIQDKSGLGIVLLEEVMTKSGWQQVESEEL